MAATNSASNYQKCISALTSIKSKYPELLNEFIKWRKEEQFDDEGLFDEFSEDIDDCSYIDAMKKNNKIKTEREALEVWQILHSAIISTEIETISNDVASSALITISSNQLHKFYTAANNQIWDSKSLILNDITFTVELFPNGHNKEQFGYVQFRVIPNKLPSNVKSVAVLCRLYCQQPNVLHKQAKIFKINETMSWPIYCLHRDECKYNMKYNAKNQLQFGCDLQLLHVKYRNNVNPSNTNAIYYCSSLRSDAQIQYEWDIHHKNIELFKNARNGRAYYSRDINNMWCLCCFPNGQYLHNKGQLLLSLKLLRLPPKVKCIEVQLCLSLWMQHKNQWYDKPQKNVLFSYAENEYISSLDSFPAFKLFDMDTSVKFTLVVEIRKVFEDVDHIKGREISRDNWNRYGFDLVEKTNADSTLAQMVAEESKTPDKKNEIYAALTVGIKSQMSLSNSQYFQTFNLFKKTSKGNDKNIQFETCCSSSSCSSCKRLSKLEQYASSKLLKIECSEVSNANEYKDIEQSIEECIEQEILYNQMDLILDESHAKYCHNEQIDVSNNNTWMKLFLEASNDSNEVCRKYLESLDQYKIYYPCGRDSCFIYNRLKNLMNWFVSHEDCDNADLLKVYLKEKCIYTTYDLKKDQNHITSCHSELYDQIADECQQGHDCCILNQLKNARKQPHDYYFFHAIYGKWISVLAASHVCLHHNK